MPRLNFTSIGCKPAPYKALPSGFRRRTEKVPTLVEIRTNFSSFDITEPVIDKTIRIQIIGHSYANDAASRLPFELHAGLDPVRLPVGQHRLELDVPIDAAPAHRQVIGARVELGTQHFYVAHAVYLDGTA